MNYRGSYRRLLGNAKAAMLSAVEIYNKPRIEYRDECVVILLLNAWELALKAVLSKNKQSIFYPKRRGEPYRTLSWRDAFKKAQAFFPPALQPLPIQKNLEILGAYRDSAVHFYNQPGFGAVVYALAQTCIVNFKDLVEAVFGLDLSEEITWQLLPLGLKHPIDPIRYIAERGNGTGKARGAAHQFLSGIIAATEEVENAGADTARLLTIFTVKLESVKRIEKADVVVGIRGGNDAGTPLAVVRPVDPNVSHPLRQTDVIAEIPELHGKRFTSYIFQAIIAKYKLKENRRYCWKAKEGVLTKYSRDIIPLIRNLSPSQVDAAVAEYKARLRRKVR